MRRRAFTLGLTSTLGAGLLPGFASAQSGWPSQTVRIIVPFPAGGTADILPRIIAEALGPIWRRPVIIENHPGAAGNIGSAQVAAAAPDGYTLLSAPPPPIAINQHLYAHLSFDPTQLIPITIIASSPNVVGVSKKLGVSSLQELIALAKSRPGRLNAANQGLGSTSHLTAALFETMAGVRFNNVPYTGTAPALNDLVAGHVDVFFDNISSSLPQHRGDAIRILAVCSDARIPQAPELPTVSESGLPGFVATAWYAVMAPPLTPGGLIAQINRDIVNVIRQPEVERRIVAQTATPIANSPEAARAFIAAESKLWGDVIRQSGVKIGG